MKNLQGKDKAIETLNKTKICECLQPLLSAAFFERKCLLWNASLSENEKALYERSWRGRSEDGYKMVIICIRNVTRILFRSLSHRNANIIYLWLSQWLFKKKSFLLFCS